jgi:hypothetical protein
MKIEVGKFYKDRKGNVHGPVTRTEGKVLYVFAVGDTSYTDQGEFISLATSDQDLIEEVPDPSLTTPAPAPEEMAPTAEPVETAPATPDAPDLGEPDIHPSRLSDSMEAYRASENHVFRVKYRELTDFEKRVMEELKSRAYWLLCHIEAHIPEGRYQAMAKTALEESVMWAVKSLTQ